MVDDELRIDLNSAKAYLEDAILALQENNMKLVVWYLARTIREISSAITQLTVSDK